ncbi:MAG: tetratricopeptide repeat protein [Mariprofundaceae bacterium]
MMMFNRLGFACLLITLLASCAGNNPSRDEIAKQADVQYKIGVHAMQNNDLPKAFSALLKAEKLDSTRSDILDALAYAWRLRGDYKKAETYYLRALRHSPSPLTYNNYGTLLLELKRYADAERIIHIALEDPRYRYPAIAFVDLGDALLGQDRTDEAIQAYRKASRLRSKWIQPQLKEAAVYILEQRYAYAQALYETILRKEPTHRDAMESLLALLKNNGDITEAKNYLLHFRDKTSSTDDRLWSAQALRTIQR